MVSFFLVKDHKIKLPANNGNSASEERERELWQAHNTSYSTIFAHQGNSSRVSGDSDVRVVSVPIAIKSPESGPDATSDQAAIGKLNSLLLGGVQNDRDKSMRNLLLAFYLPGINRDLISPEKSGRVKVTTNGNLLKKLKSFMQNQGLGLNVKIEVTRFKVVHSSNANGLWGVQNRSSMAQQDVISLTTKEVDIDELSSGIQGQEGVELIFPNTWRHRNSYGIVFEGFISISCTAYASLKSMFAVTTPSINHKILKTKMDADAVIIANDGTPIECHKLFLSVQSDVLRTMFQSTFKESETSSLHLPDMSAAGVKAFLAYLYCEKDEMAVRDSGITLELLLASHKYNIPELEKRMKRILLVKPDTWYKVDVAMRLFLFARLLQDGEDLKTRAIKLLKLNYATLRTSSSYKQLFKDEPEAAMELCEYAFSI